MSNTTIDTETLSQESQSAVDALALVVFCGDGEGAVGGLSLDGVDSGPFPHTLTGIRRDVQESSRNYVYAIYGVLV